MINPPGLSEGAYCFVARHCQCLFWGIFFYCTFYLMALYTNKISYLIKHGIKSRGAIKVSAVCVKEFGGLLGLYLITIRYIHCNKLKQWTVDSQREANYNGCLTVSCKQLLIHCRKQEKNQGYLGSEECRQLLCIYTDSCHSTYLNCEKVKRFSKIRWIFFFLIFEQNLIIFIRYTRSL